MTKLRHVQRNEEPSDLYAIRVICDVLPSLDQNQTAALANWVWSRCFSENEKKAISARILAELAVVGEI